MQEFAVVSSRDNALIKSVSALQTSSKARRESRLFVLEGLRLCRDALQSGTAFEKLIVSKTASQKYDEIPILADNSKQCFCISDELFKRISDTASPQGILAVCTFPDIDGAVDKSGRYIALENISDPSNLGAVARTAEAFGVSGIIMSADSCDHLSPKSLRASMGALLRIPVIIFDDFAAGIKQSGLMAYACVPAGGELEIGAIHFGNGTVLMIGNEANGLTSAACAVGTSITIPMRGRAESLNASVAASVAMWELMR